MHRVCILTDKSVQFTRSSFPGYERVIYIPTSKAANSISEGNGRSVDKETVSGLVPIFIKDIKNQFETLRQEYSEILVITLSSALSDLFLMMEDAVVQSGEQSKIHVIDSHTTSVGLGLLVQIAAGSASAGASLQEIDWQLRVFIPHVYTLFCLPNLSYLADANFLSPAQAAIGEMLEMLPIFSLEDGCLTAIQKVRTHRHLLETFQEFVDEFNDPQYIAIVKNGNQMRTRTFREYLSHNYPRTLFGEHELGIPLAGLLGPDSIGLIVFEKQNQRF
jgi:DegV family protein with EDD domain